MKASVISEYLGLCHVNILGKALVSGDVCVKQSISVLVVFPHRFIFIHKRLGSLDALVKLTLQLAYFLFCLLTFLCELGVQIAFLTIFV